MHFSLGTKSSFPLSNVVAINLVVLRVCVCGVGRAINLGLIAMFPLVPDKKDLGGGVLGNRPRDF